MPIIVALSGEEIANCDNLNKHGIPKKRYHYSHFNAKEDQWHYWTKLSFAGKTGIVNEHLGNGKCVLCIIDEKMKV